MIRIEHEEDGRQRAFLDLPPGEPGSGRARYAAAMHFFQRGMLSRRALEVYRVCAKLDGEDPRASLADLGLLGELTDGDALAAAIGRLVAAIDVRLGGVSGPGVDDVRALLARLRDGFARPRRGEANAVVSRWLSPALEAVGATGAAGLAEAIAAAAPGLRWITYDGYAPAEIGEAFCNGHAFASIVGGDSALPADDFDLGLFLVAPHVFYRDHRHAAPELYLPLTGPHGWRFRPGDPLTWQEAGVPVWNEPFRPHATKVGDVPFLCLYGWTRDVDEPATVVPADDWPALEQMRGKAP